ncbi:MAG: haloacid dehalogenase [Desulfotalea sp.]|nr:MAG: haloacid dehalogenase [Desulfotalea sp.]
MYKGLFVTDLDGTLLTDEKTFNPKDLAALKTLREEGFLVAIATGRSAYSFNGLIENLEMRGAENRLVVDYVSFSTGAGLMDYADGSLLRSISLTEDEVCTIVKYLEASLLDYMIHRAVPETHHFLYRQHGEENPDFLRRLDIYREHATSLPPGCVNCPGKATEVLCIVPGDRGDSVAAMLQKVFPQFSVIRATSPLDGESCWIEIFAPAVSKSSSIAWLAEMLGIAKKNICAVGNDYNDEDLLGWAETSYLVNNSPARLKNLFPVVTSNNNGGIDEAIGRWLKKI